MNDSNSPLRPIISLPPPLSGGFFLSSFFRNRGGLFPPCFTPGIPSFAIQLAKGQKINWGHDCKNSTLFNQALWVFSQALFLSAGIFFIHSSSIPPPPKKVSPKWWRKRRITCSESITFSFSFFSGKRGSPPERHCMKSMTFTNSQTKNFSASKIPW